MSCLNRSIFVLKFRYSYNFRTILLSVLIFKWGFRSWLKVTKVLTWNEKHTSWCLASKVQKFWSICIIAIQIRMIIKSAYTDGTIFEQQLDVHFCIRDNTLNFIVKIKLELGTFSNFRIFIIVFFLVLERQWTGWAALTILTESKHLFVPWYWASIATRSNS